MPFIDQYTVSTHSPSRRSSRNDERATQPSSLMTAMPCPGAPRLHTVPLPQVPGLHSVNRAESENTVKLQPLLRYGGPNTPPLMMRAENPVDTATLPFRDEHPHPADLARPASSTRTSHIRVVIPSIPEPVEIQSRHPGEAVSVRNVFDSIRAFLRQPIPVHVWTRCEQDIADAVVRTFEERQRILGASRVQYLSWVDWLGGHTIFFGLSGYRLGGRRPSVETYVLMLG